MPQRYRVNLKSQAAADLEAIYLYILPNSPQNASAMVDTLQEAIHSLGDFPDRTPIKQRRRDPSLTVRSMTVWPYLIYYRVNEGRSLVTVLAIRHGARRQPKRFK